MQGRVERATVFHMVGETRHATESLAGADINMRDDAGTASLTLVQLMSLSTWQRASEEGGGTGQRSAWKTLQRMQ